MPMNAGASGRRTISVASDQNGQRKREERVWLFPTNGSNTKDRCLYWGRRECFYRRDNLVTRPETENNTDHNREGKENAEKIGRGTLEVGCFPGHWSRPGSRKLGYQGASCSRRTGRFSAPPRAPGEDQSSR